jgi:hypothetical protein
MKAGRLILMDNCTRWNSWYNMLTVLLKQKSHVDDYYTHFESKLQKDVLELAD